MATSACRLATRTVPLHSDEPCGDAAGHWSLGRPAGARGELVALVDGLGHGAPAADAAQRALTLIGTQLDAVLDEGTTPWLPALLRRLDDGLRDTRGAAIGLAWLQEDRLQFLGIGNTRALHWRGEQIQRLSSQYGIVGGGLHEPLQLQHVDLRAGDWLLMFSDGLQEMLQLPPCLPEWEREPALLCEHLLANWQQGADDRGVLALHWGSP